MCNISINKLETESLANTKNFRFAFGLRVICLQILRVFLVLRLHFFEATKADQLGPAAPLISTWTLSYPQQNTLFVVQCHLSVNHTEWFPDKYLSDKYQDIVCQGATLLLLLECYFGRKQFKRTIQLVHVWAWILENEQDKILCQTIWYIVVDWLVSMCVTIFSDTGYVPWTS